MYIFSTVPDPQFIHPPGGYYGYIPRELAQQ